MEEADEILERIDDVPFGKGEERVGLFAPIAFYIDRGNAFGGADDAEMPAGLGPQLPSM